ncbi:hypothetical protein, partial [Escherichia coli]|uniref:hypothetical protein n=1 Tax=Escherichia coli TaxID=562 RepID=UPI002B245326
GHAKIPCQLRQYHWADTVETPVGPAGTTSQTCQNHVHEMLEPHPEQTENTCQTRLNNLPSTPSHLLDSPEPPT